MSAALDQILAAVPSLSPQELLTVRDAITHVLHTQSVESVPIPPPARLDWETATAEEIIADIRAGRDDRF